MDQQIDGSNWVISNKRSTEACVFLNPVIQKSGGRFEVKRIRKCQRSKKKVFSEFAKFRSFWCRIAIKFFRCTGFELKLQGWWFLVCRKKLLFSQLILLSFSKVEQNDHASFRLMGGSWYFQQWKIQIFDCFNELLQLIFDSSTCQTSEQVPKP